MRHLGKKNWKIWWRERMVLKKKVKEGMQDWNLTSEQSSLKNLSSTTNKDTGPELYLIIPAYSPWLCFCIWEPTNSFFPTTARHLQMPSTTPNTRTVKEKLLMHADMCTDNMQKNMCAQAHVEAPNHVLVCVRQQPAKTCQHTHTWQPATLYVKVRAAK